MSALTKLQLAVLVQLARGYPPKQIAAALGISANSVRQARRRALKRLGISNDVQLGMRIKQLGLISEDEQERIEARRQVVLKARELQ